MSLTSGGLDSFHWTGLNTPLLASPFPNFYGMNYGMNYGITPGMHMQETSSDAFEGSKKEHKPITWKEILLGIVGGGAALVGITKLLAWNNAKKAKALEAAKKAGFKKGAITAGGIALILAGLYGAYKYFTAKNQNQTASQNMAKAEKPQPTNNEQKITELSKEVKAQVEPSSAIHQA